MEEQTQQSTKETTKPVHDSKMFGVSLRGLITLIVVLTVCAMSVGGINVVEPLYTLAGLCVGYYFGQSNKTK